jgi:hypothetical protein
MDQSFKSLPVEERARNATLALRAPLFRAIDLRQLPPRPVTEFTFKNWVRRGLMLLDMQLAADDVGDPGTIALLRSVEYLEKADALEKQRLEESGKSRIWVQYTGFDCLKVQVLAALAEANVSFSIAREIFYVICGRAAQLLIHGSAEDDEDGLPAGVLIVWHENGEPKVAIWHAGAAPETDWCLRIDCDRMIRRFIDLAMTRIPDAAAEIDKALAELEARSSDE